MVQLSSVAQLGLQDAMDRQTVSPRSEESLYGGSGQAGGPDE